MWLNRSSLESVAWTWPQLRLAPGILTRRVANCIGSRLWYDQKSQEQEQREEQRQRSLQLVRLCSTTSLLSPPNACPPQPPPLSSSLSFAFSSPPLQAPPPRLRPCSLSWPRPCLSRRPPPPTPHPRTRLCALPLVARDVGPPPLARRRPCPDTHCSHLHRASLLRAAGCRLHGPTRQRSECYVLNVARRLRREVPQLRYRQGQERQGQQARPLQLRWTEEQDELVGSI